MSAVKHLLISLTSALVADEGAEDAQGGSRADQEAWCLPEPGEARSNDSSAAAKRERSNARPEERLYPPGAGPMRDVVRLQFLSGWLYYY